MTTLAELATLLPQARTVGDLRVVVQRVHSDSRSVQPGDWFVALRGPRFDGNAFIAQAKAQGAVAALCEGEHAAQAMQDAGLPGLVVPDARLALAELAMGWRTRFDLPVVAVTGSNGKTTVTQMLASIARTAHPQGWLATAGNLNNDIGVPLSVLRLRAQHALAVFELGMNHVGEIATLAAIARPTVALVNNAQREHLEFMGSVAQVAIENGQVLAALPPDGVAVWPAGTEHEAVWWQLAGDRRVLRFALGEVAAVAADVTLTSAGLDPAGRSAVHLHTAQGSVDVTLAVAGIHNLHNAAASATCALAAGVALPVIAQGLQNFAPVAGRSQVLRRSVGGHAFTLIDDSYNANPDSVRAAIAMLTALPAPRLLTLGDMGEVGNQGPQFHAEVLQAAVDAGIEHILVTGTACTQGASNFVAVRAYATADALQLAVQTVLPTVRSVLVKGSRFMRMERVVQALLDASEPLSSEAACC